MKSWIETLEDTTEKILQNTKRQDRKTTEKGNKIWGSV